MAVSPRYVAAAERQFSVEFSLFFPLLAAICLLMLMQKDFSGSELMHRRNNALIAALWVSHACRAAFVVLHL